METINTNPLVSIVIPVYNGADYLREAIDSALGQTYRNIEVIVVNDGSDDDGQTEAIAKSYGDRIRYFYKENGGVSTALNVGIKNMRGEWFAWLSHDDLFSNNRIETDMMLCQEIPETRVLFCRSKTINADGVVIAERDYPIQKVTSPREALKLGGVGMCSMTIHRSCFDQVGLFNEANRTTQDTEMTLRLSNKFPFFFNSEAITYRREHPNRGTYTLSEQHKRDLLVLCDAVHDELSLRSFFPDLGDDEDEIAKAWIWMGNWYDKYGASHYADECYRHAVSTRRSLSRQWMTALRITVKKLNNPILNELMRYAVDTGARVKVLLRQTVAR